MVDRQFPRPAELLELMQFKKPELNLKKRRLESASTQRRPDHREGGYHERHLLPTLPDEG